MTMFLSLSFERNWKSEWSSSRTIKTPQGLLIERNGIRLIEGWSASFKNGCVRIRPFRDVYAMTFAGDQPEGFLKSFSLARQLKKDHEAARQESWGMLMLLCLPVFALISWVLSLALTAISLPTFAVVWVFWAMSALSMKTSNAVLRWTKGR